MTTETHPVASVPPPAHDYVAPLRRVAAVLREEARVAPDPLAGRFLVAADQPEDEARSLELRSRGRLRLVG